MFKHVSKQQGSDIISILRGSLSEKCAVSKSVPSNPLL